MYINIYIYQSVVHWMDKKWRHFNYIWVTVVAVARNLFNPPRVNSMNKYCDNKKKVDVYSTLRWWIKCIQKATIYWGVLTIDVYLVGGIVLVAEKRIWRETVSDEFIDYENPSKYLS